MIQKADIEHKATLMTPAQRRAFEMYVAAGEERSLSQLVNECERVGMRLSIGTLKRWSTEYKWPLLAELTDREIARRTAEEMIPIHVARSKSDLDSIDKLKGRFRERVDIDDRSDPRYLDIDLADFFTLLKMEKIILDDPSERKGDDPSVAATARLTFEIPQNQLEDMMRISARAQNNLPSADQYVGETIEQPDTQQG